MVFGHIQRFIKPVSLNYLNLLSMRIYGEDKSFFSLQFMHTQIILRVEVLTCSNVYMASSRFIPSLLSKTSLQ